MDPITAELFQRLQLEIEALAEIAAGNPSAVRGFGENRQAIRGILERSGYAIVVNPDPYLETALSIAASAEQNRRLAR